MDNAIKIRNILSECLQGGIAPEEINPDMDLNLDLNLDSIIFIEWLIAIEERFDIIIPDEQLDYTQYTLYGDLEKMVLQLVDEKKKTEIFS